MSKNMRTAIKIIAPILLLGFTLWTVVSIVMGDFAFTDLMSLLKLIGTVIMVIFTILAYLAKSREEKHEESEIDKWHLRKYVKNASNNWIKYLGVIEAAHDWVDLRKMTIRTGHKLRLTFSRYYDDEELNVIIINRKHEFIIYNPFSDKEYQYDISVTTDLGTFMNLPDIEVCRLRNISFSTENKAFHELDRCGGFSSVKIGNDTIDGDKLLPGDYYNAYKVTRDANNTKVHFNKPALIPENGNLECSFDTFGVYLLTDKLQWVFNEFCDGLDMTVTKKNRLENIRYRFNHHEHKKIMAKMQTNPIKDVFNFSYPIFPFQGFEMHWSFDK